MPKPSFDLFGLPWPGDYTELDAIIYCIRHGGLFKDDRHGDVGAPLWQLYRRMQSYLWPDDDHHEWSDLMLRTIIENRITAIQGPKDCSKTHTMAKYGLTDYFCFPNETLTLLSSTDLRGLELRVWGDLKDLYVRARDRWPECPGHPMDSLHGIFTDRLEEDMDVRDIRKGLICIPCVEASGQWKGLERYTGIKQKRRRLLGDEVQFMEAPYLTSLANLNKIRSDFKGVFVGNPVGQGDPLDQLAEPKEGWDSLGEISTTMTWKNRMNGVTVQLYGPDSPANKNPGKYTYLLDQSDIDYIVEYWGKESAEYWNQAAGIRQPGVSQRRIVTRDMAAKFHAQDPVVWRGGPTVRIYSIDAGYGGDRCIGGWGEFGQDINGKQVLNIVPPTAIPIRVFPKTVPEAERVSAEDQIADFARAACMVNDIPAERVFHDATGRGSLGTAFARLWRPGSTPVEFGGRPTERPVMADLYLYDEKIRQRRLIRCDEHYDRRVSELAFNVRYVIESGQMRGLPNDVLDELCAREWKRTKNGKIQVELKEEAKERLGRSPDKADWCAILVEGARQCGFQIARLQSEDVAIAEEDTRWREALQDRATRLRKSYSLTYS